MDLFGDQSAAVITAVLTLLALATAVVLWLLVTRGASQGAAPDRRRLQAVKVRQTIDTDGAYRAGVARDISARAPPGDFHRAGPSQPPANPRE